MRRLMPDKKIQDLTITKVDRYQGYENHIVILNFVVTEAASFLCEMNRLIASLSRARDALYVLENKSK